MGQNYCRNCTCGDKEVDLLNQLDLQSQSAKHLPSDTASPSKSFSPIQAKAWDSLRKKEHLIIKIQSLWRMHQVRKQVSHLYQHKASPKARYFSQNEAQDSAKTAIPSDIQQHPAYAFKSGAVYTGEWKGTQRHGVGCQVWSDGAKYDGTWRDNKASGHGTFWHVDGDVYVGSWKDDKACGKGSYTHLNGAKYEGEWVDDLQQGFGIEVWADGSRYEGFYNSGKKDGYGIYIWQDGSRYAGQWVDNKINGKGVYTWLDGRRYEGEWRNNNMHGRGVYTWKDGRRYEGMYKHDKKDGYGEYTWTDGRVYKGDWKSGKQHGPGLYITRDGEQQRGTWKDAYGMRSQPLRGISLTPTPRSPLLLPSPRTVFLRNYQYLHQQREEKRDLAAKERPVRGRKKVYEIALLRRHAEELKHLPSTTPRHPSPAIDLSSKHPVSKPLRHWLNRDWEREERALVVSIKELDSMLNKVRARSQVLRKGWFGARASSHTKR